jgi:hypothetical protein
MISQFPNAAGSNKRRAHLSLSLLAACGAAALAASASTAQNQPAPEGQAAEQDMTTAPETADARRMRETQESATARDDAQMISSTLPAAAALTRCVPPPPDLDAWYPLDGNGTDLILAKNATPAAVTWVPAVVSGGARLLTNASRLTVPNGPVLNQGLGDFSIDLWLYIPPAWISAPNSVRTLIDKRTNVGGVRGYSLYYYGRRLGFQLADGGFTNYSSTGQLTAGWNHVAATIDRDNPQGIVFYRNGAPIGTANPTGRQGNLDNASPTLFGHNVFNHGSPSIGAVLDEIEFFDRALRPIEVRSIAAAGRAGKCKP